MVDGLLSVRRLYIKLWWFSNVSLQHPLENNKVLNNAAEQIQNGRSGTPDYCDAMIESRLFGL